MSGIQDGPIPPDEFGFSGKCGRMKRSRTWQFVKILWNSPNRTVTLDGLAKPLWGDSKHDISIMAVGSLRRDANRFFTEHGMPFRVRLSQDEAVLADDGKRRKSKGSLNA